jgi:hypothetical protein
MTSLSSIFLKIGRVLGGMKFTDLPGKMRGQVTNFWAHPSTPADIDSDQPPFGTFGAFPLQMHYAQRVIIGFLHREGRLFEGIYT